MSGSEPDHDAWVEKAESDFLNIENNLASARVPWDTVCFHAQQAGEKYLKALLVKLRTKFPPTHDLQQLLALCLRRASSLKSLEEDCQLLTAYSTLSRYLTLLPDITEDKARSAVAAAERIRTAVRQFLTEEPSG